MVPLQGHRSFGGTGPDAAACHQHPVPTTAPHAVPEAPRFSDPKPSRTSSVLLQPVLLLLMITGPKLPFSYFHAVAPRQCWTPTHLASSHPRWKTTAPVSRGWVDLVTGLSTWVFSLLPSPSYPHLPAQSHGSLLSLPAHRAALAAFTPGLLSCSMWTICTEIASLRKRRGKCCII